MYKFDAKRIKNECVQWIRNWFEENGDGCNAIIGISGGKDSSVVAALCVEALGKHRVIGVLMPNGKQGDIDVAMDLCETIGIVYHTVNIHGAYDSIRREIKGELNDLWSLQAATNLPARLRMCVLYAMAQNLNGRVANTCNLSEDWVGYATRYGDGAGDFSPLSNLTVAEVKAIGYECGLPKRFIEKTPIDGLCGKTDEDNLGFSYAVLDRYIRTGEIEDMKIKEKIDMMHEKNLFKLQLMPSFKPTFLRRVRNVV